MRVKPRDTENLVRRGLKEAIGRLAGVGRGERLQQVQCLAKARLALGGPPGAHEDDAQVAGRAGQLSAIDHGGRELARKLLLDRLRLQETPLGVLGAPRVNVHAADPRVRHADLEKNVRVAVGLTGDVAVKLERVLQQGEPDRLDLGHILQLQLADSREQAVDRVASLAQVREGLQPPRFGKIALALRAHIVPADHDRQRHRGDDRGTRQGRDRWVPVHPLERPLPGRRRASPDGLGGEEPTQVIGQRKGARIARLRRLVQALEADRFEVARNVGGAPLGPQVMAQLALGHTQ